MFGLGTQELLLILVLVVIIFGARKIPDLARSLGKGLAEFRKARAEGGSAKTETSVQAGTCPKCQGNLMPGDRYCSHCGQQV